MSGQCVYFSLNRLARVTEEEYELFIYLEKKITLIAEKYGFYLDLNLANDGEYQYLTIHHLKPIRISFSNKEIFDLPEIEDDTDFYNKTESFIIEASKIYPIIKKLSFSSPGKRFFAKQ